MISPSHATCIGHKMDFDRDKSLAGNELEYIT